MAKASKIILGLAAGAALLALWGAGFGAANTASAQSTSTATLIVKKIVVNSATSNLVPSDFFLGIAATGTVSTSTIVGNASGTVVTLSPGAFQVVEPTSTGITTTMSADCSGTIAAGETRTCIVTNTVQAAATTTPPTTLPGTGGMDPLVLAALALTLIAGSGLVALSFKNFRKA